MTLTLLQESVDLAKYIDQVVQLRRNFEQMRVAARVEQLPIYGQIRDSSIAIRVHQANGEVCPFSLERGAECS